MASRAATNGAGKATRRTRRHAAKRKVSSPDPIGPLTRRAGGVIRLPKGKTARQVLEEALLEKYLR